jgi:hypothetical protein
MLVLRRIRNTMFLAVGQNINLAAVGKGRRRLMIFSLLCHG